MANQPHASRQAVTWRLARPLVDRVKARAAENGETMLAFVTRALEREVSGAERAHGIEQRARELASKDDSRMDEFGAGEVFAARQILGLS